MKLQNGTGNVNCGCGRKEGHVGRCGYRRMLAAARRLEEMKDSAADPDWRQVWAALERKRLTLTTQLQGVEAAIEAVKGLS